VPRLLTVPVREWFHRCSRAYHYTLEAVIGLRILVVTVLCRNLRLILPVPRRAVWANTLRLVASGLLLWSGIGVDPAQTLAWAADIQTRQNPAVTGNVFSASPGV
jgi:hypothetical protein